MTFTTNGSNSACTLFIKGELDALTVPDLRGELDRLAQGRARTVVVDLSGLRLIDSSGVAALVSVYKRVRARGGKLVVRAVRDQPLAVLKLLKLDEVLMTPAESSNEAEELEGRPERRRRSVPRSVPA
jgi:anti-sigma B factor antagonist